MEQTLKESKEGSEWMMAIHMQAETKRRDIFAKLRRSPSRRELAHERPPRLTVTTDRILKRPVPPQAQRQVARRREPPQREHLPYDAAPQPLPNGSGIASWNHCDARFQALLDFMRRDGIT